MIDLVFREKDEVRAIETILSSFETEKLLDSDDVLVRYRALSALALLSEEEARRQWFSAPCSFLLQQFQTAFGGPLAETFTGERRRTALYNRIDTEDHVRSLLRAEVLARLARANWEERFKWIK